VPAKRTLNRAGLRIVIVPYFAWVSLHEPLDDDGRIRGRCPASEARTAARPKVPLAFQPRAQRTDDFADGVEDRSRVAFQFRRQVVVYKIYGTPLIYVELLLQSPVTVKDSTGEAIARIGRIWQVARTGCCAIRKL
jgi:hypothetical protein